MERLMWEYRELIDPDEDMLTAVGRHGWEAYAVIRIRDHGEAYYRYFLKRPIVEPDGPDA